MAEAVVVLVVEDDETLRDAVCDTLIFGGYQPVSACNGEEALRTLLTTHVDLVISDVQMDKMDGSQLLSEVRSRWPSLPFVMVTAYGSVERAVDAMRHGATDYLVKPFEAEVLLELVSRLEPHPLTADDGMIAHAPNMKSLCDLAERVAGSDATVLISGDSGTGKELMARYIHTHSPRAEQPFMAINCAAIPETMLESMLFGYEKGAYTGAVQSRAGKFEQANGGTLLLDEISEMDISLQAKLLRVIQEKEVERLGGSKLIPLDVRVLATTNRKLREEVAAGRFREDLYYRLNVFPIHMPPLKERKEDIVPIAQAFLARYGSGRGLALTGDAETKLLSHHWPGNVRELENTIQRATILAHGVEISAADIYFEESLGVVEQGQSGDTVDAGVLEGDLRTRERQLIVEALKAENGSRKDAAARLGISARTLRYKLARLKEEGIAIPAVG